MLYLGYIINLQMRIYLEDFLIFLNFVTKSHSISTQLINSTCKIQNLYANNQLDELVRK